MKYKVLGNTEQKVSQICLGTMTWGEQNTEKEAHQQMDYGVERGINFFDAAEMYPVPPKPETQGRTEEYIGNWFKKSKQREKIVLATKIAGPGDWLKYIRGGSRFTKQQIAEAVETSLKRLQTDYIDLYQLHWPDRNTNFFGKLGYTENPEEQLTPLAETIETLDQFVREGKIKYWGFSNETPWGVMKGLQLCEVNNWQKPVTIQNPYNLLNRTYEIGLAEISHRENIGLLAYSPMAFGVLSGKYLDGARPAGARITLFDRFTRYTHPKAERATRKYVEIAKMFNLDPGKMALAYVNTRSFLTSNIIGATNLDQLQANIDSINLNLSDEVIEAIEAVHQELPNPSP